MRTSECSSPRGGKARAYGKRGGGGWDGAGAGTGTGAAAAAEAEARRGAAG